MDNITHTLLGFAVGEAALRFRDKTRPAAPASRATYWLTSGLANNLPDFDVLYAQVSGGKLGYLLQHRGFTHTLIMVVPQALLVVLLARLWAKQRGRSWDRVDGLWLTGLTLFGVLLHIALDALNSYGVHPLWPFNNRWFYGDTLFIVEPALWLGLLPALAMCGLSRPWKLIVEAAYVITIALCWVTPFAPRRMALAVTLFSLALWGISYRRPPLARLLFAFSAFTAVILVFFGFSFYTRRQIERLPTTLRLHDIVLTPLPINPLCWGVITIESDKEGREYRMKTGLFTALPDWMPANVCPSFHLAGGAAPLQLAREELDPRVHWVGEYVGSLPTLREKRAKYCAVAGLLHFSRAPFLVATKESLIAGDLRYDRGRGHGFAQVEMASPSDHCPRYVPPWIEPFSDLLSLKP